MLERYRKENLADFTQICLHGPCFPSARNEQQKLNSERFLTKQATLFHVLSNLYFLTVHQFWKWLTSYKRNFSPPWCVSREPNTTTGLWVLCTSLFSTVLPPPHLPGPKQTSGVNMQVGKYGSSMTLSSVSHKRPVKILNFPAKELPTNAGRSHSYLYFFFQSQVEQTF